MARYDPLSYPHPSRRSMRFARGGMVATSQPLAAAAGCEMLQAGGNAIDAAIATAICLTVVEPTSNGIGGDNFAMVWDGAALHGLNASGRAPAGLTIERVRAEGHGTMPDLGPLTVTVPGAVSGWAALSERFGALPFARLFAPAIRHAAAGYAINPTLGSVWAGAVAGFAARLEGPAYAPFFDTFAPGGAAPGIGTLWRSPDHAATLQTLAREGADSFYRGRLAEAIDGFARAAGMPLSGADLDAHRAEWVVPLSTGYRGAEVWELPPNGQGMIALVALNILQRLAFDPQDPLARHHALIEATKLAMVDGRAHIADPAAVAVPTGWLLSDDHAARRAAEVTDRAGDPQAARPPAGGTVYLATADAEGRMVSMIQSNYKGFGAGLVVPGTGVALHNRGREFSLDPAAPNGLAPGRRPYHTIIPGFLRLPDGAMGPFGVMGGYMQPQGHVQVVSNLIDAGLNPQAALDAPRWRWDGGREVTVEPGLAGDLAQALARRGHRIRPALDFTGFGRGQIILRDPDSGVLAGGTDPRADGEVAIL